jgi:Ca-activated chloride channel homolog
MKSEVKNIFLVAAMSILAMIPAICFAQEERALTRQGNKDFYKGNYTDAEANYKKALDKKNNFPETIFNLGDAIYKQGNRHEEAAVQFDLAAKTLTDSAQKAKALHNLGNAFVSSEKYQEAVNAYKQALKMQQNDKDTKYNLAYAQAKLKQQQQNQDNKKDDKKDQNKKDQDQKKPDSPDKKDNKDGKNGDKKDKQGQQPQPKLSKEAAEKLLQALQNEEQKTQEKMNKKQARPVEVKIEKDW